MNRTYRMNEPSVASETIDGEVVVINLDTGTYFSLQNVAGRIWECAANGLTTGEILSDIAARYEGKEEEVRAAVVGFLSTLVEESLFVETTRSASGDGVSETASHPADPAAAKLPFVPPVLNKYTDMQELLFLDPIHEVDDTGWPNVKSADEEEKEDDGNGRQFR